MKENVSYRGGAIVTTSMVVNKNLKMKYYADVIERAVKGESINYLQNHRFYLNDFPKKETAIYILSINNSTIQKLDTLFQKIKLENSEEQQKNHYYEKVNWRGLFVHIARKHNEVLFAINNWSQVRSMSKKCNEFTPYLYSTKPIPENQLKRAWEEWFRTELNIRPIVEWTDDFFRWEEKLLSDFENEAVKYTLYPAIVKEQFCKSSHTIKGLNNGNPLKFYYFIQENGSISCLSQLLWKEQKVDRNFLQGNKYLAHLIQKKGDSKYVKVLLPFAYKIDFSLKTEPTIEGVKDCWQFKLSKTHYVYWALADLTHWKKAHLIAYTHGHYQQADKKIAIEFSATHKNGQGIVVNSETDNLFFSHLQYKIDFSDFADRPYVYLKENLNVNNGAPTIVTVYNNRYFSEWNMLLKNGIGLQERNEAFLTVCDHLNAEPVELLESIKSTKTSSSMVPFYPEKNDVELNIDLWDNSEEKLWNDWWEYFPQWTPTKATTIDVSLNSIDKFIQAVKEDDKGTIRNFFH